MRSPPELDQQIKLLMQQLPVQRQQLKHQTLSLTMALRDRLSTPEALAVATVTGALIACWLQCRACHTTGSANHHSDALSSWSVIYPGIWLSLWRTLLS